jgi:hypothetical protein
MFWFGWYVVGLGAVFLLLPDVMLSLAQIPGPADVVPRLLGLILLYLGIYYVGTGRSDKDLSAFFRLTVYTRGSAIIGLTIFWALGWVHPIAIGFGAGDLAGALWTLSALKREGRWEQ